MGLCESKSITNIMGDGKKHRTKDGILEITFSQNPSLYEETQVGEGGATVATKDDTRLSYSSGIPNTQFQSNIDVCDSFREQNKGIL